jgi:Icc-related predicted phosphoesterase
VTGPVALCLADLHSSATALRRLDGLMARERFDVVLAAGDITIAGHAAYAADFIAVVRRHDCPLLLVHGNNDTFEAVEIFRREGVTIHRQERQLLGTRFVGFGGDGTATHDLELAEGELEQLDPSGAILLTHVPPRGLRYFLTDPDGRRRTNDESQLRDGERRSSFATRPSSPTLAFAPRAQICGHIHHQEGIAYLGPTKVVKLRAAMWNRCAVLDLRSLGVSFRNLGAES